MMFKVALLCLCLVLADARPDAKFDASKLKVHQNQVWNELINLAKLFDSKSTEVPASVTTEAPTVAPVLPTEAPTVAPVVPTEAPTVAPVVPTEAPTVAPVVPTEAPTDAPTTKTEAAVTTETTEQTTVPLTTVTSTAQPKPKPCEFSKLVRDVLAIPELLSKYVTHLTLDILEMVSEITHCVSPLSTKSKDVTSIFSCNIPKIVEHFIDIPLINIEMVTQLVSAIMKVAEDFISCFI